MASVALHSVALHSVALHSVALHSVALHRLVAFRTYRVGKVLLAALRSVAWHTLRCLA